MTGVYRSFLGVALGASLLAIGCSQSVDPNRPATHTVSGIVTHQGQPVEGAMVKFELADGSRSAVGKTDASGKYVLTTFGSNDGAVAGEYKVAILKYETRPVNPAPASEKEYVPPEMLPPEAPPKNLLPAKYADVNRSGLTATVSENGENKFDFAL